MKNTITKTADSVVRGINQTFRTTGAKKKKFAMILLGELLAEQGLELSQARLSVEVEKAVRREKLARWSPIACSFALVLCNLTGIQTLL